MRINPLSTHSNAFAYLRYKFPRMVDSFADIPVLELTYSEWDEYSLTGYGYLIKEENIENTKSQLSNYPEAMLKRYRSMNPEIDRDLHIYDFYKKIGTTPFFLILEGNEAAIIHEVAHVVWNKLSPEERSKIDLPEVSAPDNDEYLQSDNERFTHMTEMEYFKSQGMSFDDYFRLHNAREYELINNPSADPKLKELAQMDYNDYRQIWDHAKTSSSRKNWFTKLAETLTVITGTHDKTNRPIYILQGPTYPIKGKLGRSGLGFNYWRPVGWWMYQERMTPNVSTGLQTLGFDLSALGGSSPAPVVPEPQVGAGPLVEPATAAPVAPTGVTDQSWEDTQPKSKWYGFPIKKPIYETMVPVEVEGQQIELKVSLGRWFKKGRRRVPSYVYDIFFNDEVIGRLAKSSPGDWGTYDEGEIAGAIPEVIQARMALGSKSKMYNGLVHVLQLSGREPELTAYLKQFEKYGDGQTIDKTIHLDEPGYEGDYPVKFFTYTERTSWDGYTALVHPEAPRYKPIFFLGKLPPDVHTIEQFHQWLEGRINDPEIMENAKSRYLDYLQSFPFLQADQDEATGQFQEILPIINSKSMDVKFFRQKFMSMGYLRPHLGQKRTGPGMQLQDQVKIILDRKKILNDAYESGKLSRTPDFFYTAVAYLMHRKREGKMGFGADSGQIGTTMWRFHETLKQHGLTIEFDDMRNYIYSLADLLLAELVGVHKRSTWENFDQFYGSGTSVAPPSLGLDPFIQFVVLHGIDENFARENPVKAYRTLAHQFHPDRNPGNPEAEELFVQLGNLWDAVPPEIKKRAESWLWRVCIG